MGKQARQSEDAAKVETYAAAAKKDDDVEVHYHPGDDGAPQVKPGTKERGYTWLVRFEILAVIVFVALIIYFAVTK